MDENGLPGSEIPQPVAEEPPAADVPVTAEPVPAPSLPRVKTDVPLFILGLITPPLAFLGLLWVASLLDSIFSSFIGLGIPALLLAPFIVMFVKGRANGDSRMMSYGKGGLFAYLAVPLFMLIAFGTCLVTLNA